MVWAACRNRSGAGLPSATSSPEKIRPSKRRYRSVIPWVNRILAWLPLEAMKVGTVIWLNALTTAGGRGELVGEGGADGPVQLVDPARWQGATEPGGDRDERGWHADPEEVTDARVVGGRNTQLAQHLGLDPQ